MQPASTCLVAPEHAQQFLQGCALARTWPANEPHRHEVL